MERMNIIRNELNGFYALAGKSIQNDVYVSKFPLRMEYYRQTDASIDQLEIKLKTYEI